MVFGFFKSSGSKDWGVKNDSGQWECFRVSEQRAREEYERIHYGKLVNNIRSNDQYYVVETRESAHT